MIDPTFECRMCKRDLMETTIPFKFVIIDGKTEQVCKFCSNKYTPDEIKSVLITANFNGTVLVKEYDIVLFMHNQFTEKDIERFDGTDKVLNKYIRKILGIDKDTFVDFKLQIKLVKKRFNKCELCSKLLDYQESIYFKTGKANNYVQVCKECEKL